MVQPGERAPAPGPLALVQDLANTADLEAGRDTLTSAAVLSAFCVERGLGRLRFAASDVERCRELREALRDVCGAHVGEPVPAASAALLESMLAAAPLVLSLRFPTGDAASAGGADDGRPAAVPAPGLDGLPALTAHLAAAILAGAADGTWPRLKACTAHSCRWVYYDRSPAGRSRWCTMSICGSRAKMRAYRSRTR